MPSITQLPPIAPQSWYNNQVNNTAVLPYNLDK